MKDMMIAPIKKMTLLTWRAHFRPIFSVRNQQKRAPKKAAAWKVLVIFELVILASSALIAVMPKASLKPFLAIVVPKKAESDRGGIQVQIPRILGRGSLTITKQECSKSYMTNVCS